MPDNEDKKTEEGNLPAEVTKVLEDIKTKLEDVDKQKTPVTSVPSVDESREDMKKRLNFNEDQMRAHEELLRKQNAPMVENLGWMKLEKHSDLEKYRQEIETELSIYPKENRNADVMEKIYYMVKGKHADSQPAKVDTKSEGDKKVVSTRVSGGPGYSGSEPSLSGSDTSPTEEEKISDLEKFVADKLGVPEKDYVKSRNVGRSIRELKVPDSREVRSLADVELKRLVGR